MLVPHRASLGSTITSTDAIRPRATVNATTTEVREGRPAGEHRPRDGSNAVHGRGADDPAAEAEHRVGSEHRDERVEVAPARGGEERVDELLAGGRGRRRAAARRRARAGALFAFATARRIHFHPYGAGVLWVARFLPLTHALALMRYGLLHDPSGLHNVWRMSSTTGSALLSLAVLAVFALLLTRVAVRVFSRAATQ